MNICFSLFANYPSGQCSQKITIYQMDNKASTPPHVPMHGIPTTNSYQHAVALLSGVHMAAVVLDHLATALRVAK
jgi:hypothetical protein